MAANGYEFEDPCIVAIRAELTRLLGTPHPADATQQRLYPDDLEQIVKMFEWIYTYIDPTICCAPPATATATATAAEEGPEESEEPMMAAGGAGGVATRSVAALENLLGAVNAYEKRHDPRTTTVTDHIYDTKPIYYFVGNAEVYVFVTHGRLGANAPIKVPDSTIRLDLANTGRIAYFPKDKKSVFLGLLSTHIQGFLAYIRLQRVYEMKSISINARLFLKEVLYAVPGVTTSEKIHTINSDEFSLEQPTFGVYTIGGGSFTKNTKLGLDICTAAKAVGVDKEITTTALIALLDTIQPRNRVIHGKPIRIIFNFSCSPIRRLAAESEKPVTLEILLSMLTTAGVLGSPTLPKVLSMGNTMFIFLRRDVASNAKLLEHYIDEDEMEKLIKKIVVYKSTSCEAAGAAAAASSKLPLLGGRRTQRRRSHSRKTYRKQKKQRKRSSYL